MISRRHGHNAVRALGVERIVLHRQPSIDHAAADAALRGVDAMWTGGNGAGAPDAADPVVASGDEARARVIHPRRRSSDHRPIRAETRATLVRAIALGRRWLDELVTSVISTPQAIAQREGCSERHVERTISLAFLAPDLVRAAVDGRLPRGVGVSRLIDLPIEWQHQWQILGLQL
jgi:hypothetical protein